MMRQCPDLNLFGLLNGNSKLPLDIVMIQREKEDWTIRQLHHPTDKTYPDFLNLKGKLMRIFIQNPCRGSHKVLKS
jgi:hypothetical protein